ncbi:MAG: type IV toxin-antitoxin system AbiEi family antitoxin domain-containing protein [Rickettsiaceae bacterium]|nr:type IV toxin-antitoxin system AbiEi family antitoxin domain-containing protein [Rickettsiaceae bacterium]
MNNAQVGIKSLLSNWQQNTIKTASELKQEGYYNQLLNKYHKSGWLDSPAYGIYTKPGAKISWLSVINLLQKLSKPIHVGAMSALKLHGIIQYVTFNEEKEELFILNSSGRKWYLPKWFSVMVKNYEYHQIDLFKENKYGFVKYAESDIEVTVSSPERAILELLYFVPKLVTYEHAYELIDGARVLVPTLVQKLLEDCTSIKVKRLFLYLADKHNLPCFEYLDINKINLGAGDRLISGGGKYSAKYKISVPVISGAEDEEGIGYV